MDKKGLIRSAEQLEQVKNSAACDYKDKSELLVSKMNSMMSERSDISGLIGEKNMGMMRENHANHARFMLSIFTSYNPEVFVETILWVFRAYRSHGFAAGYWNAQLELWMQIIPQNLSPDAADEIMPYYSWMYINIPVFVALSDKKLKSEISGN